MDLANEAGSTGIKAHSVQLIITHEFWRYLVLLVLLICHLPAPTASLT